MQCEICGSSRRVLFFDLSERTSIADHLLHHALVLCQGCADGAREWATRSDGLYALSVAPAHLSHG